MKEIGSIFPLYDKDLQTKGSKSTFYDSMHYSLCREALLEVAEQLQNTDKIVLLPAYTCNTVYMPFKQLGWECVFYSINRNLSINLDSLKHEFEKSHPSLVIFHPYFGLGFTEEEKYCIEHIHNEGCKILVDNTQCIFSEERLNAVDYYTGSFRKWFPIPDGGFLQNFTKTKIDSPKEENIIFTRLQSGAMYLRGVYFQNEIEEEKELSIQLNKAADLYSEGKIEKHKMSDLSESLLEVQDLKECVKSRYSNFKFLFEKLRRKEISFVIDSLEDINSAPLYFAIFLKDRKALQTHLAQHHIYLPVLWPIDDEDILIDAEVKYIYDHILCIPIDQRYDLNDMEKIVSLINEFYD